MKLTQRTPAFQDGRGSITDVTENQNFNSATIIVSKKGAVRGNHFHRATVQYIYLLTGKVLYRTRLASGEVVDSELLPGNLLVTEPLEEHAMQAIEDSTFLVLTDGPRQGSQYESDTFKITTPLIVSP